MSANDLDRRVTLVLGAGSVDSGWGNGKAAAYAYAKHGAKVVAVDLVEERAQETVDLILRDNHSAECIALRGDVTNLEDISAVVSQTINHFGRIDILHYNAGIGEFGDIEETSEEDWDSTFSINVKGAFLACKLVLPHMERQRKGVVTLISSVASVGIGSYPYIAYQASKAALNHFARAIAVSYASKGIRANAILPGLLDTPVIYAHKSMVATHGGAEEMRRSRDAASPTGKMGTAWDIANAAVFLASDEASYINGVMLPVDGGLSCRMR